MLKGFMERGMIVKKGEHRCDECGNRVDSSTAVIVEDCGDKVPVCLGCVHKFENMAN